MVGKQVNKKSTNTGCHIIKCIMTKVGDSRILLRVEIFFLRTIRLQVDAAGVDLG